MVGFAAPGRGVARRGGHLRLHRERAGHGRAARAAGRGLGGADAAWAPLLPGTPLLPDTPHRFRIPPSAACDVVRLDVFPDGGVARLRLYGSLTPEGLSQVYHRWAETAG